MAKSIEQRAKEYILHCSTAPSSRTGRLQGYIQGARDQRKLDIEKACEWFRRENSHAVKEWLELECDRLRKYMEE